MSALIQQTDEWLEMRRNKIGASDAPIIMEVSPYKKPNQLMEDKLTGAVMAKSQAMQRGIDLEPIARERFMDMTDLFVLPQVVIHPENNWMMASFDGMDIERKNIVEIKCPLNRDDHLMASQGIIPKKYYPQLQHQLEVCHLDMAYYFSFDGNQGVVVKVYRDDKYIQGMMKKEKEFWDLMQESISSNFIKEDYQHKNDDLWKKTASEWISVNSEIKHLESKREELKESLILQSMERNSKGGGVKVSKIIKKGSTAYGKIPELIGVDLELYRNPSIEYWKIGEE